jgi:fructokinase
MGRWGMDTSGVQVHTLHPTGRVTAHVEDGEPSYEIEAHQAYDAVSPEGLPPPTELAATQLLYHGSLGVREETSALSLSFLRETLDVPTLLDVNLRDPWWSRDTLTRYLEGTEWVKVNREEAGLLTGLPVQDAEALSRAAAKLQEEHRIETLVVTLGADGAMAVSGRKVCWRVAPAVSDLVDPVGAGDAFSAVMALGIQGGWRLETVLLRATEFAADVCRIRGATTEDPELYSRHLRRWADAT